MSRRRRPSLGVMAVVAASLLVLGGAPAAHADPVYPSWDDVQAARGSAKATAAQVKRIESTLEELESQASSLFVAALEKGEAYNQAREALDAAAMRADTLALEAATARATADASAARASQLVAQLVRAGGGNITVQLLVGGTRSDDLLYQLGTMSKLAEQSAAVLAEAEADANTAGSLGEQAAVALDRRSGLAAEAEGMLAEANTAAQKASARIAEQAAASARLQAQLVALTGDAATAERAYLEGIAAEQAAQAAPPVVAPPAVIPPIAAPPVTAPPIAAPPVATPPVVAPPVVVPPVVAPPVVAPPVVRPPVVQPPVVQPPVVAPPSGSAVAAAIAYARGQLGKQYEFGGAGPATWDCSGLTKASYAAAGVFIGTHSVTNQFATMSKAGRLLPVAQRQAGDLLFYSNASGLYHVAIYIGGGQMLEAPNPTAPVRIVGVRGADLVGQAGRPTG
jgi:cell wall-associated NlpC family hydrolase